MQKSDKNMMIFDIDIEAIKLCFYIEDTERHTITECEYINIVYT